MCPPGLQGNGLVAVGLARTPRCISSIAAAYTRERGGEAYYLMQRMHQIPILQLVADKTVGNPVSTEEKSTVKAAILTHALETRRWMLVKSTYLSILGIAILAWLQVIVVNTASFATLRLRNVKRRKQTNLVDAKERN